jgi:hypothetical protein
MKRVLSICFTLLSLTASAHNLQSFYENGNAGIKDGSGKVILPAKYYSAYVLEDKAGTPYIFVETLGTRRKGVFDQKGKVVVPCEYDDAFVAGNKGYIQVERYYNDAKNYGIYSLDGKEILGCKYANILTYDNSITVTGHNGLSGIADPSGKIVLDCVSTQLVVFQNGSETTSGINYTTYNIGGEPNPDCFKVKGGKYGLICSNPVRIVADAKYSGIEYNKDYFMVNVGGENDGRKISGGKWGVIDVNGKEIVKPIYDGITVAAEGLFSFNYGGSGDGYKKENGKWGLVDANGKELLACEYDNPIIFSNDVASVKKDGEVKIIKNPLIDNSSVQIAQGTVASYKKQMGGPAVSRYPAPDSDVDSNIPQTSKKNENTFAFIVANENYPDAPVPYSLNDGRMFAEYCEKAFGIPKANINMYEDATYGKLIAMMDKVKSIAEAYEGDATVVIYYAGHGFPDDKQSAAYLLPIDGSGSDITTTGYSLEKLYAELSKLPLKDAIVFLDACFSGAKREDDMLAQSRGVAIKVKQERPAGKMLVFSASQGDETAHQMEEKHHGMFTYFLLKGIQQNGGDVTMGDLTTYVTKNVKRQSVVINNKKQTPTVIPSDAILDTWQTIKIR